jgi:integrase
MTRILLSQRVWLARSTILVTPSESRNSATGAYRDPGNFRARWSEVRGELGVPGVTTHSFRKAVATLIDDEGLSARIGADHLGHSRISMTQGKYMARGRVHTAVTDRLDRTINDGCH